MERVLGFNLKLGADAASATSVEDFISEFRLVRARETVTRPATGGKPNTSQAAGSRNDSITIGFIDDRGAQSLGDVLWDIAATDDAKLYFSGTLLEGAVSATNPRFYGFAIVTQTELGGASGSYRSYSVTFPVDEDGIQRATTDAS